MKSLGSKKLKLRFPEKATKIWRNLPLKKSFSCCLAIFVHGRYYESTIIFDISNSWFDVETWTWSGDLPKGTFTNYVDKFFAFFDHLPPYVAIFGLPLLVNVVCERPQSPLTILTLWAWEVKIKHKKYCTFISLLDR